MKPAASKKPASKIVAGLRAARRFVFGRIRVRRAGAGVHIAFGETTRFQDTRAAADEVVPTPVKRSRTRRTTIAETVVDAEFRQMQQELCIFLNGAKNRRALRHLAFFEDVMVKRGAQALETVSIDTLKKSHVQLNLLLNVAPSRTLRVLASKMLVALVAREDEGAVRVLDARTTDFMPSHLTA